MLLEAGDRLDYASVWIIQDFLKLHVPMQINDCLEDCVQERADHLPALLIWEVLVPQVYKHWSRGKLPFVCWKLLEIFLFFFL